MINLTFSPSGHVADISKQTIISIRIARVVTFGKKLLPFACKFEICYFCYDATKDRPNSEFCGYSDIAKYPHQNADIFKIIRSM